MQKIGIDYVSIGSSLLYHFGARGSHFPDDNFSISSNRQEISESKNRMLWIRKWNYLPRFNEYGMIIGLKYN